MLRLERLETRTQELTFLVFSMGAITVLLGGLFYLFMNPVNLQSLTGIKGTHYLAVLFNQFGFASFFPALSLFYLGGFVGERVSEPKDFGSIWLHLVAQFTLQIFALFIAASVITILESYFKFSIMKTLQNGAGGEMGQLIGGKLFKAWGLYGSLSFLFLLSMIVGILSGIIQLTSIFAFMVDKVHLGLQKFVQASAWMFDSIIDWTGMDPAIFENAYQRVFKRDLKKSKRPLATSLPEDHPEFEAPAEEDEKSSVILLPKKKKKTKKKNISHHEAVGALAISSGEPEALTDGDPDLLDLDALDEENENKENQDEIRVQSYKGRYKKPDPAFLKKGSKAKAISQKEMKERCINLEERLKSFQIRGKIIAAHTGIRLTMYEFQPDAGVKLSKITGLADDLALLLGASSIRILAPIPGKTTVGIEVPNENPAMLTFSDLAKPVINQAKEKALPIAIGKDVYDKVIVEDIAKMPHLLVSGTTGSGKSVFMNTLINSLIYTRSPKELRFLMVDPKMIELTPYNGIPHLLKPVVTDLDQAKELLVWAEKEMDRRYQQFSDLGSRNIESFNEKIKSQKGPGSLERRAGKKFDWEWEEMPYIVVIVDELADLMITQGKEVEIPITRIAQKARAAGIHLVLATQRPSSDIVTGLIKTNFPTRISFKVSSAIDSRTIIDTSGAEKLLGNGDMLYMPNGKALQRIQASFISEDEVKKIVRSVEK